MDFGWSNFITFFFACPIILYALLCFGNKVQFLSKIKKNCKSFQILIMYLEKISGNKNINKNKKNVYNLHANIILLSN